MADIVYSNGAPNQHNGNAMGDFLQSEDFTLAAPNFISTITFWDLEAGPGDFKGSLYWAIQKDAAGIPGAIVASSTNASVLRSATGLTDTSGLFFEFKDIFNIAPTALSAGKYWLTLHDGPLGNTDFADFYWEWSNDDGNGQEFDLIANAGWDSNFAEHAFQLSNVPEPASLLLLATVLVPFAVRRLQTSRKG